MSDRRANPGRAPLEQKGLYHSFRLPDGRVLDGLQSLDLLEGRLDVFGIPRDLTGLRVLDIGPWDGFCTFALEQRGAEVVAIDYVDLDTFRLLHRAYNSRAQYLHLDVYQLDPRVHGQFDIVIFFGVLYHLKHPLLALERICAVTRGVCHIDSFAIDAPAHFAGERPVHPYAEFYPYDELGGQLDNWTGPTVSQIEAWVRAAGFARPEWRGHKSATARVTAHRHWNLAPATQAPVRAKAVTSHRDRRSHFSTAQEEYICVWCEWEGETPALTEVYPEVDGFGVAPLSCAESVNGIGVTMPLPPGLQPGVHEVRVRIGNRELSAPLAFGVDLPPGDQPVELVSVQDAFTFVPGEASDRWVTLWVRGLTEEVGISHTSVWIGGAPHDHTVLEWRPAEAAWQINVELRSCVCIGEHQVFVVHRGARSGALPLMVKTEGARPKGLESV